MGRGAREDAEVSRPFQIVGVMSGAVVLLAMIWAMLQGPTGPAASWIQQNKWFVVTIVDVYAGLGLAIALMWVLEDGPKRMVYAALFLILGNIAVGGWVALRLMGSRSGRSVTVRTPDQECCS